VHFHHLSLLSRRLRSEIDKSVTSSSTRVLSTSSVLPKLVSRFHRSSQQTRSRYMITSIAFIRLPTADETQPPLICSLNVSGQSVRTWTRVHPLPLMMLRISSSTRKDTGGEPHIFPLLVPSTPIRRSFFQSGTFLDPGFNDLTYPVRSSRYETHRLGIIIVAWTLDASDICNNGYLPTPLRPLEYPRLQYQKFTAQARGRQGHACTLYDPRKFITSSLCKPQNQ
jgi:hypothetical protein